MGCGHWPKEGKVCMHGVTESNEQGKKKKRERERERERERDRDRERNGVGMSSGGQMEV